MQKLLIKKGLYLVGACFVFFTWSVAQEPDSVKFRQLPDVEVVGSSRIQISRHTTPLQVLGSKEIEHLGLYNLSDAVRRFSGVTVKDYGGIGGLKTISVRSLGAHHTAVSYDGTPVLDAQSGQADLSRFTLDNVEILSLSMGQVDDIFQPARIYASAGALNIKTRKPRFEEKPYLLSAKMKNGSFGFFNPSLSYAHKLDESVSASFYTNYTRAAGNYPYTLVNGNTLSHEKRINSDIETVHLEGNLYAKIGDLGQLETKLYTFHSGRGLPGAVNFYDKTSTERLWNDNTFVQSHYKQKVSEMLTTQVFAKYSYAYSKYRHEDDKYATGVREDRNTRHEYYGSAGILYTPFDCFSTSLTTDYTHSGLHNNFYNAPQPRRNDILTAFAMQYEVPSLTLTGSLLGRYLCDEVETGNRRPVQKRLSPAVSLSWKPFKNNTLRVRTSYKDIYRVPTFTDLYYLRVGNTTLKPENTAQYNVGLTWNTTLGELISFLRFSVDGYYNKVEDKIVALPTMYVWKMMNMGQVEIKGADVNISGEAFLSEEMQLLFSGNYTYQHAIDITNPDAKNYKDQIPYTPRHTGGCSFTLENPWVNVSYILTAVGERYALPQNTKSNKVNAYVEQSISLNRMFELKNTSLRLQGEVLNIADTQYDVIQYYPMPGRSWRLTITFIL